MKDIQVGDQVFFKTSAKGNRYIPVVVRELNEETQSVVGAVTDEKGEALALFEWPIKRVYANLPNGGK